MPGPFSWKNKLWRSNLRAMRTSQHRSELNLRDPPLEASAIAATLSHPPKVGISARTEQNEPRNTTPRIEPTPIPTRAFVAAGR
eukprot:375015-Alexandrium_andersonii.AAC.1